MESESARSLADQLPVEIVENIIDYLHDDCPSLRACSALSSTWAPRTRRHLFKRIASQSDEALERLFDLIEHPNSLIDPMNVRQLYISKFMPPKLGHLPRVIDLQLTELAPDLPIIFLPVFASVINLVLMSVTTDHSDLLYAVSAMPNLASLHLRSISWHRSASSAALANDFDDLRPPLPATWRSLQVSWTGTSFLRWMLHRGISPPFSCLHLAHISKVSEQSEFLKRWGPGLECTSLHGETDLSYNTKLKHVHIPYLRMYRIHSVGTATYFSQTLARIASDQVETILFDCQDLKITSLDWSDVEAALNTERFRNVKLLQFRSQTAEGKIINFGGGGGGGIFKSEKFARMSVVVPSEDTRCRTVARALEMSHL